MLLGGLLVFAAIMVPKMGGAEKLIISINSLLVVPLFAPTLWGLFSKKIGIRDMITVALTSFAIGLALRFGLSANPLILESSSLWTAKAYLAENSKNVEVLAGVVLPILLLIFFEKKRHGVDRGAERVLLHSAKEETILSTNDTPASFDPFPARMVLYSLLVIGAWIIVLGLRETEARSLLLSFGIGLAILAGGIQLMIRKLQR